jgi:hypothetical protein
VNGFAGRIQAGTGTVLFHPVSTGGIQGGDSYPPTNPWSLNGVDPTGRDYPPYAIWSGDLELNDGQVVVLTPTIWELDIGGDAVQGWIDWLAQTDAKFGPAAKNAYGDIWPVAKPFFDAISIGIQTFATLPGLWSPFGKPMSRPIGLERDPADPNGSVFKSQSVVLTAQAAEYLATADLNGRGAGIFGFSYRDDPFLRGEYQIWLQIRKIGPGRPPLGDGTLIKEASNPRIYIIYGGAKFWIPNAPTFNRMYPGGWNRVVVVPDGDLANVPDLAQDGTILREEHNAYVWRMDGGKKCWVTTPSVLLRFGGWPMVRVVPDLSLANIPTGAPIA